MKIIITLSLLLLASPAFGELTKEDLRTIIKEEVRPIIKEEITVSEKRTREYINLKIDALDKSLNARIDAVEKNLNAKIDAVEKNLNDRIDNVDKSLSVRIDNVDKSLNARIDNLEGNFDRIWLAMLALITAAIALPQFIIAYTERRREKETQIGLTQLVHKSP